MTDDDLLVEYLPTSELVQWQGWGLPGRCWVWFDGESEPTEVPADKLPPYIANAEPG